jgi:hypothetical protein
MVSVINELLQDFSTQWPKENTSYFVDVGLPLLFSIFRGSKTEGRPRESLLTGKAQYVRLTSSLRLLVL